MNAQDVKSFLHERGIKLAGIAPASRLRNVPDGRSPEKVLPGAKSVIAFGLPMSVGAVQAKFRALEDGLEAADSVYGRYGRNTVPAEKLMAASYALCHFIERGCGAIAMPMMSGPWSMGRPLSLRHAAVAAGLGEFGLSKAVITPEYGPRVRWGAVITQLELEPDEMYSGPRLCEPEKCCVCREICPAQVIPAEPDVSVDMAGREVRYGKLDFNRCRVECYGLKNMPEHPTDEEIEQGVQELGFAPGGTLRPPTWKCDRCIVYCPAGGWKEKYSDTGLSKFGK